MSSDQPDQPDQPAQPDTRTPAEIEADLERTRADLGETVALLGERLDVPSRVKARARRTRDDVTDQAHAGAARLRHGDPQAVAVAAGVVLAVVALVVLRRRARR